MEPGWLHLGFWIPTFVGMTVGMGPGLLHWGFWIPTFVGMTLGMEPGLLHFLGVLDSHFRGNDGGDGGMTV